tara:strand:+ start:8441 stop:9478 length:1038 start_codon:yes stop_codon:yes gene_type:complete
MNYTEALTRMRGRRDPDALIALEKYGGLKEEDPVKYLVGAMSEIPDGYTKKTYEEAERVKNQISKGLLRYSLGAEYRYQGSVTKNTHILAHSDIDVLSLEERFIELEHPQVPPNPYKGDPVANLCEMREIIDETLVGAFPQATVDSSGAKCINISGGSLCRSVDVVPSNWYDTNQYVKSGNEVYRGVHILDFHQRVREKDAPFIHTALFVQRDENSDGNLRRLVRLCKSLKYDSGRDDMPSSYDIEAIMYAMGDHLLGWGLGEEIQLARSCCIWLRRVAENAVMRNSLCVPDGKRKIFEPGKTTLNDLNGLRQELDGLLAAILNGLQSQSRSLTEARINHMVAAY